MKRNFCPVLIAFVLLLICLSGGCLQDRQAPSGPTAPGAPSAAGPAVTAVPVESLPPTPVTPTAAPAPSFPPAGTAAVFAYGIPRKSAHYESNTPAHGDALAGVPVNVVLDFNFDLGPGSVISVTSSGKEYGIGNTTIDPGRLAMRRPIDPAAPNGLYEVVYNACWPDGSCHEGNFRFAIDRSLAAHYTDLTGRPEVTIGIKDIAFDPAMVRISRGTNVTWINRGSVEHFVNTDSHPAHTYYLPQNSRGLARNDTFLFVFNTPGIYPYHCSAHADLMTGSILVE